jgi:hypothetical protein
MVVSTELQDRRHRRNTCGVPLLSQACDLGSVGHYASDGVLELSVFKVRGAIPERVQATPATRSGSETKGRSEARMSFRHPQARPARRAGK